MLLINMQMSKTQQCEYLAHFTLLTMLLNQIEVASQARQFNKYILYA